MVSSITMPMPARAQTVENPVKETGGGSFQDALQKTIQEQRNGPAGQEQSENALKPETEEWKPDQGSSRTEEKTDLTEAGIQQAQIFMIPGQENLVLLLNQGFADVSQQAETAAQAAETALTGQLEGMAAAAAAGADLQTALTEQAAAQDLAGSAEMKTLSAEKELPVQAAGQKTAGESGTAETLQPAAPPTDKAQLQTTERQDSGRAAETKQPEPAAGQTAELEKKHSGADGTGAGENGSRTQGLKEEQPQPHQTAQAQTSQAAQAVQPQENPEMSQAAGKGPAETVFRPSQPETLAQELPAKLAEAVSQGKREFTIQLEPEALGKMMIRAGFENGKAVISITCASPKTLELLSAHAKDMGAIMESHMGTPTNVVVEKTEPDYLAQQQQQGRQNRQSEEQQKQRENSGRQEENGETFLQQLRLGLV